MTIEEIQKQLDYLSDKIDLINSNLQFNITTFLAVMALVITITGFSIGLLVKNIVNKRFNEEIKNIDNQRDKKIEESVNEIRKDFKKLMGIEIGKWTPILKIGNREIECCKCEGTYTKQDNLVNINMYLHANLSEQNIQNGNVMIDGLPFISTDDIISCSIGDYFGVKTDKEQLTAIICDNSIVLTLSGENHEYLSDVNLKDDFDINISAIYTSYKEIN